MDGRMNDFLKGQMDGTLNFDCYSLGAQLGIDNHNNLTPTVTVVVRL